MAKLADPLRGVVGEKAAKRLATLGPGLRTVGDPLSYYPRRYETRGELTDLAGLRDRHVGRALTLMHGKPAHPWTIEELATEGPRLADFPFELGNPFAYLDTPRVP